MTTEKQESNKIIAEFMKLEVGIYPSASGKGYWVTSIGDVEKNEADRLPYHTDWNWLMDVVEKIEALVQIDSEEFSSMAHQPYSVDITSFGTSVSLYGTLSGVKSMFRFMGGSKPENTYNAVVDFIKWYNENNSNE